MLRAIVAAGTLFLTASVASAYQAFVVSAASAAPGVNVTIDVCWRARATPPEPAPPIALTATITEAEWPDADTVCGTDVAPFDWSPDEPSTYPGHQFPPPGATTVWDCRRYTFYCPIDGADYWSNEEYSAKLDWDEDPEPEVVAPETTINQSGE